MRPASWRLLVVALLGPLAMAGCASVEQDPYADQEPTAWHEETVEIGHNNILAPPFGGHVPIHARVSFEVVEGGPIDVWLATRENCEAFSQADFQAIDEQLNRTTGMLVGDLEAGDHCILFDNSGMPLGEASPTGPVTVRYRIDVWEKE